MAQLIWSPRARRDAEEICAYIARGSKRQARLFAQRLLALVESIPQQPRLGGMVPEYDRDDVRERLLHKYRIVYRLRDDVVEIVTISQGARLLPPDPPE